MKQKTKTAQLETKSEYARMRGIDPALITRRIADGLITVVGDDELVDVAAADAALRDALGAAGRKPTARRRGSTAPRPGSGRKAETAKDGGLSLHAARTLRAREDAKRARIARRREEIELARLRGEYIAVVEVSAAIAKDYGVVRTKMLSLPNKLATQLAAESTPAGCFKILWAGVCAALTELVQAAEENARAAEAAEAEAAAKAKTDDPEGADDAG